MNKNEITVNDALVSFGTGDDYQCMSTVQARYLAAMLRRVYDAGYIEGRNDAPRWKLGWLINKCSWWLGVHYSQLNKRWCINLLPCVTLWIVKPGGKTP